MAAIGGPLITGLIISVGTTVLSKAFGRKKKTSVDDSKPATLTDRGSRVALVVGSTRGGPIHALETGRDTIQESFSGGGGGKGVGSSGGQNTVHIASGWHIVAVGPAFRLTAIYMNGEKVFPHPNDPQEGVRSHTHLSGTTLNITRTEENKDRGQVIVYWGEDNQPQNLYLNTELGYSSNHAFLFHFVWRNIRLGGSGTWPAIEYEYSVHPYNSGQLLGVEPTGIVPTLGPVAQAGAAWTANGLSIPPGAPCPDVLTVEQGPPAVIYVEGDLTSFLGTGDYISLEGQGPGTDGRYEVASTQWLPGTTIFGPGPNVNRPLPIPVFATGAWFRTNVGSVVDRSPFSGGPLSPPGLMSQPFSAGGGINVVQFRIDANNGSSVSSIRATLPVSAPDPDPSSSGTGQQYNIGANRLTVYVHDLPGNITPALGGFIGFSNGTGTVLHGANISHPAGFGGVFTVSATNGAVVESTSIGNNWYLLDISYTAGAGTIPSSATDQLFVRHQVSSNVVGFVTTFGNGQNGSIPALRYTNVISYSGVTKITLTTGVTGLSAFVGRICPLQAGGGRYQGANPAHIIYQLLFSTAPHGLGLNADCYDIASLSALGLLFDETGEGLRSHITLLNGDDISGIVDALLQEIGVNICWDVINGIWTFNAVREKLVPDATVDFQMIQRTLPSRAARFGEVFPTRLSFLYLNMDLRYRQDAVLIADDGTATLELRQDVQSIPLRTVRDPEMALQLGEIRSLWEFAHPQSFNVVMDRNAAVLRPGDVLDFQGAIGTDILLRVLFVEVSSESMTVRVGVVTDAYAQRPISGIQEVSSSPLLIETAVIPEDCIQRLWELSAFLGESIQFAPLRTSTAIGGPRAAVLTSADDVNYSGITSTGHIPGGTLASDFLAAYTHPEGDADQAVNQYHVEDGPLITECNANFGVSMLSLNDADWYAGRQWLVVGDEVMFVREFQPFGGTLWQAKGVLRARLDTVLQDHAFTDPVFVIVRGDEGLHTSKAPSSARGFDTWWKMPPGATPPGTVTAVQQMVKGAGVKPMPIANFATASFSAGWVSGEDLDLRWDFRLPAGYTRRTGSGMQGYGEATGSSTGLEIFPGIFRITLTDPTATVIVLGPVDVAMPYWSVPAADLTAAIATAGLSAGTDLKASMGAIYATGQVGDRVELDIPFVG